jgi:hypothetical protein
VLERTARAVQDPTAEEVAEIGKPDALDIELDVQDVELVADEVTARVELLPEAHLGLLPACPGGAYVASKLHGMACGRARDGADSARERAWMGRERRHDVHACSHVVAS